MKIDVVVPVFNALDQVRECLRSILSHRDAEVGLIVVNDASLRHVGEWLRAELDGKPRVTLIEKTANEGYLAAVNDGLAASGADIVVCQNSDTMIFETFFDDLRRIFASDDTIGIVNPVSTWANWTRIPFPEGMTVFDLNARIREAGGDEVVDIGCASGFSIALRRGMIDRIGAFDPVYSPGYWEETDYCMRALQDGWRVVCAKGLFVFHHGWSSFGRSTRNDNMHRNEITFRARWGAEFARLESRFATNDPLRTMKADMATWRPSAPAAPSDRLSVLYILPSLGHYGGIISVVQVVNRLILEGIDARIAVVGATQNEVLRYGPCYFNPEGFPSLQAIAEDSRPADIAMATHWSTAFAALRMRELGKARAVGYFVQDFEPEFFEPGSKNAWLAEETYRLIDQRICKTAWLKRRLDAYGGQTRIIPLGLNGDIFADHDQPRRRMLLSMSRPSSKRRNWPRTLEVFRLLRAHRPDIDLGVFGFGFKKGELPDGIIDFGLLETATDVARVLNQASVLLDASTFQGFGRPGLEAIACGVVPVLTKNGGITAYAKHMHNSLLVDPNDTSGIVTAVCRLFDDPALYDQLKANGRGLAAEYCMRAEGRATADFLHDINAQADHQAVARALG
jgi:GT2 family glycosyltransferase/glycosyltransferase involved in cell wall biosynthesis